ncbi:beta-glucosidase [Capsulimonas corticalis]|uniref:beta-glucosidase n=1 Tax=Capsulimonas corticalis TaxID=2219043 RepID=A0A402D2N2_9BACT|nr:beta-glucosidase BglX [Capsulimonas corticalis]BDI29942.1 beta-glucosidase [Capsulimonas corticalis]
MLRLLTLASLRGLFVASGIVLAGASAPAAPHSSPRPIHPNAQLASPQIERRVNELLKKMTLPEKLGQLVQYNTSGTTSAATTAGPNGQAAPQGEQLNAMQLAERGLIGSLLNVGGQAQVTAYQHAAVDKSRLHIPLLTGADVLHGYRTGYPIPLGVAASFDPDLGASLARMAAEEATPSGIRWFYAPMVDISRDARWGRTAEGSGEDAYLGSAMARAYVHGFQGDRLDDPQSVAASVKHFAAYGAAEAGREYNTTDMSDSRLRQDYLPPYKAAVDAGAVTLMSAFNALNGVPATANPYLLDTILRKEWGFDGFVVSDDRAIVELINHGVALDPATAAQKAINAGVEVDMRGHVYDAELPALVRSGRVSLSTIDEAVRRVLRVKFALGLFEHPYPTGAEVTAAVPEHRVLVRKAAEESFVLLQNKPANGIPALPLRANAKIALIGPMADTRDVQGAWGGGRGEDSITIRKGLEEWAAGHGGSVVYARGTEVESVSDAGFAEAEEAARQADVVVLVLGESGGLSGEAAARAHIDLPGNQQQLIDRISSLGKPVVMVLFSGRPLVLTPVVNKVDAILEVWFPGTEAGHAVARVLYGEVSPSGKLPMSFPQTEGQEPLYYNQLPTGRPARDANLNVRGDGAAHWLSRYIDAPNAALFPFGFGLSYTQFGYSDVTLSRQSLPMREAVAGAKSLVIAKVTVTNTGKAPATEVTQCYVGNVGASLEQPIRSLKGFVRVTLAPGESKEISFPLGFEELSFFDNAGHQLVEPSMYNVWIGGDSLAASHGEFQITR